MARIASGGMPLVSLAQGVIDAFTMFPTRRLSLLLGMSMRTAEEDTPSEEVERLLKVSLEIALVPLPSLVARHLPPFASFPGLVARRRVDRAASFCLKKS